MLTLIATVMWIGLHVPFEVLLALLLVCLAIGVYGIFWERRWKVMVIKYPYQEFEQSIQEGEPDSDIGI